MKRNDLAYIAGILDGEGYIGVKKAKPRKDRTTYSYQARIQVRMVEAGAVRFLAETLGGIVYPEKAQAGRRAMICYQASDLRAATILRAVLPFLRVKRAQAEAVLSLRALQATGAQHRTKVIGTRRFPNAAGVERVVETRSFSDEYVERCEAIYLACKRLNRVGLAAMEL